MSPTLYLDAAETLARNCVRRHVDRTGLTWEAARDRVAEAFGWTPGTLYNLLRGRLKKLDGDLRAGLTRYAIEDIEHEIAALTRELECARGLGKSEDPALARRASRLLAQAQALHAALTAGASL
ncbi:hypothetical protein [Methylobacterium brachiatum]|uniref:hypothetical protein n=1 Tax=Methylobacterium brachiatum TaxID=269660 RepID=UPI000EFD2E3B|nr:hypothetical protein [Methylobacterium brachiatum]AYO81599.1 hypothetical protein EBB05_04470 [Methylobacterium brachiatum]